MIPIQRRNWLQRFMLRVQIGFEIIFQRKRGVVLFLERKDLRQLIENNELKRGAKILWSYWGMAEVHAEQFIKSFAANIDDTEIICSKAEWEASAQEEMKKRNL